MGKSNLNAIFIAISKGMAVFTILTLIAFIIIVIVNIFSILTFIISLAAIGVISFIFYKHDKNKIRYNPQEKNKSMFFGRE